MVEPAQSPHVKDNKPRCCVLVGCKPIKHASSNVKLHESLKNAVSTSHLRKSLLLLAYAKEICCPAAFCRRGRPSGLSRKAAAAVPFREGGLGRKSFPESQIPLATSNKLHCFCSLMRRRSVNAAGAAQAVFRERLRPRSHSTFKVLGEARQRKGWRKGPPPPQDP